MSIMGSSGILPTPYSPLVTHPHIFGDRLAFLLRQGSEDRCHHLARDHSGVDVLLHEAYADADDLQIPRDFQAVFCVPGETGYGFDQDPVDPSPLAVSDEALKILSFLRRCSADTFVSADVDQLPIGIPCNQGGVIAVLGSEGIELIR